MRASALVLQSPLPQALMGAGAASSPRFGCLPLEGKGDGGEDHRLLSATSSEAKPQSAGQRFCRWLIRYGYQKNPVVPWLKKFKLLNDCPYRVKDGLPGCSSFGLQAIERYGVAEGIRLTALRLLSCTFIAGFPEKIQVGPMKGWKAACATPESLKARLDRNG